MQSYVKYAANGLKYHVSNDSSLQNKALSLVHNTRKSLTHHTLNRNQRKSHVAPLTERHITCIANQGLEQIVLIKVVNAAPYRKYMSITPAVYLHRHKVAVTPIVLPSTETMIYLSRMVGLRVFPIENGNLGTSRHIPTPMTIGQHYESATISACT